MLGALPGESSAGASPQLTPMSLASPFDLRSATPADVPVILACIRGLAEYEKLAHEVVATEELLHETLFGARQVAEVILAYAGDEPAGFALFFHNYSTFLARPGIYLEDLFVFPRFRGRGLGRLLLARLARIALDRRCGRLEWSVLDWNVDAIRFYESVGAKAMTEWTVNRVTGDALRALAGPPA
jgi:GNAT superfamily N-acetyltransferase